MRVFAIKDLPREAINIYVEFGVREDGTRIYQTQITDTGNHTLVNVGPGGEAPMYCKPIPMHIAEQIAEALSPRPEATERHLDDAIDVRDRALSLVERVIENEFSANRTIR
jgi:hypothetical protein